MEIITNLEYNKNQHTLDSFLKANFKPTIFPMVSHTVVGKILNGRNMIQAMEQLMVLNWRTMRQTGKSNTGQRTLVDLADDTIVSVHLLQNHNKDKMVMMVVGTKKEIQHIVIAYVGAEEAFHDYLKELGVSKLECYDNLIHLDEEETE